MSIYRKQNAKPKVMYDKLRAILAKVKLRYDGANVIIGGDFNDATPPMFVGETSQRPTKSYTRFNI